MKCTYTVRPGLTIEVEGETQKDLFRELAGATEVFGEPSCGLCGGTYLVPVWRNVTQKNKTFEYPEWRCVGCQAKLSMGCTMEGGRLFPHRKLDADGKPDRENGTWGKHAGWTHYRGEKLPTAPDPSKAIEHHGDEEPIQAIVDKWVQWLDSDPSIVDLNARLKGELKAMAHVPTRKEIWGIISARASASGLVFDRESGGFVQSEPAY